MILYNQIPNYNNDNRDLTKSSTYVPSMECREQEKIEQKKIEQEKIEQENFEIIKENFESKMSRPTIFAYIFFPLIFIIAVCWFLYIWFKKPL